MNGNFGGGNGSASSPWLIEDAFDLDAVRTKSNSHHFRLKNDIDLNVYPFNVNGWTPIPFAPFTGSFDGNYFTIRNLYIERNTAYNALFSHGYGGTFKNLTCEGFRINMSRNYITSYNSCVAAYPWNASYNVTFENIVIKDFQVYGAYIGGVCGRVYNGTFRNIVVDDSCTYYSNGNYVGGVVGYMRACALDGGIVSEARRVILGSTTHHGGVFGYTYTSAAPLLVMRTDPKCVVWNTTNWGDSGMGYGGSTSNQTPLSAAEMRNASNFAGTYGALLEDISNPSGGRAFFIFADNSSRPKMWMEKAVNRVGMSINSDITGICDFGDVLEGTRSFIRTITIILHYDLPVRRVDVTWERRQGVSPLSTLELSKSSNMSGYSDSLYWTGTFNPGHILEFYVRVNTQEGMEGEGLFDLVVDVTV